MHLDNCKFFSFQIAQLSKQLSKIDFQQNITTVLTF